VELSGTGSAASLTFATALVLDAQRRGETTAWVTARDASFFPPDAAENGVDLEALPVVRVPETRNVPNAGERLVRCGAFDLVVLDLGERGGVPMPLLTRLLGLAEKHRTAVLFLTEKPASLPSLGSPVSLRAESRRERRDLLGKGKGEKTQGEDKARAEYGAIHSSNSSPLSPSSPFLREETFACEIVALRDKRRPEGWSRREVRRGPDGVR
jgi:recombination protein RecA